MVKETLKIDVKDLTEYIQKKEIHDNKKDLETEQKQVSKVCTFLWKEKVQKRPSPANQTKHIEQEMHNCDKCDFQATKSAVLSKHKNIKHRTTQEQTNDVFRCSECELQFSEKWNLMNHKKDNHERTELCEYYLQDRCSFTAQMCWNLHQKPPSNQAPKPKSTQSNIEGMKCYTCKETF